MLLEKLQGTKSCLLDQSTIPHSSFVVLKISDDEVKDDTIKQKLDHQTRLFSAHFHDFVQSCLARLLSQRPADSKLLHHKFFEQAADVNLNKMLEPIVPITPATLMP